MPTAYSYVRFSSEKQSQGDSIRRQQDLCNKYLDANQHLGLELDKTLNMMDKGLSAYKGVHASKGALGVFMRMVEDGFIEKGSYLLVESLDRLSRQEPRKASRQLSDLVDADIVVVTLMDGREYSKDTMDADGGISLILSIMMMARAHEESKTKGRRIKSAWANKFGQIAEGKQLTKRVPFWINKEDKNKTIKVRAEIVKKIFKLADEGLGGQRIASHLNEEGIEPPTKLSNKWAISSVKKVLHSKAAIGILVTADGQEHEGYYPRVISEKLWLRTRYVGESSKATRVGKEAVHPLAGLCICAVCKSTATRSGKTGRVRLDGTKNNWKTLVCAKAANKASGCAYRSISYQKILDAVLTAVRTTEYIPPDDEIGEKLFELGEELSFLNDEYEELELSLRHNRHNQTAKTKLAEVLERLDAARLERDKLLESKRPVGAKVYEETMEAVFSQREVTNSNLKRLIEKVSINFLSRKVKVKLHGGIEVEEDIDDSSEVL